MQDKTILNEFAAKITKAKILHDNTQAACLKLRREAAQFEKEYHTIRTQREAAENMERSLKNQLSLTQNAEKETAAKCRREEAQLEELRENRKKLKREKEIEQHTLLRNKLELDELVTKRQQLEATAKSLSEKLEGVTSEKEVLQEEYNKTEAAIRRYNDNIAALEAEIQKMREVITTNTVPVYNAAESQLSPNPI
jgi:chromosome segregation ATPase